MKLKHLGALVALAFATSAQAADVVTKLIVNSQSVPSIIFNPTSGNASIWYWQNPTGQTIYIEQADLYLYPGHGLDYVGIVEGGVAKGKISPGVFTSSDPNNNVNDFDFILYERCVIPPDMDQHIVRKWNRTYQIAAGGWVTAFAGGTGNLPVTVLFSISYSTTP